MGEEPLASAGSPGSGPFLQRIRSRWAGISWLALVQTLGPVLIAGALVLAAAVHFVRSAPPSTLTIASAAPGSRFNLAAQQYLQILARNRIKLIVLPPEGSSDH